jgi:hypothetical protein
MELKNAQKRLSHLQRLTGFRITGGMRSTPTYALEVMLMLPPLHLFIKQDAIQVANTLLELLIRMTDETPLCAIL